MKFFVADESITIMSTSTNARQTILIVDDEEMVLTLGRLILERRGYDVVVARSGEAAVQLCGDLPVPPDCVIVDYTMPEMNGRETLIVIRRMYPELPVLISSGYSNDDIAQEMQGVDYSGLIHKPYRQESLVAALEQVLAER